MYVGLTPGNIPYAVALARELHSLGVFGRQGPEFNWDFCTQSFIECANDRRAYARFAVNDQNEYVGGIVAHLAPFFFSPEVMAVEDALYVKEDVPKRAATAAMLVKGLVEWASSNNAVLVQTGDIAAIDSHAVYRFYTQIGFEKFGVVYQKRLR